MSYSSPAPKTGVEVLEVIISAEQLVAAGDVAATPKWLAQWRLDGRDSLNPVQFISIDTAQHIASMRRDSGVSGISITWSNSILGVIENDTLNGMTSTDAAFTARRIQTSGVGLAIDIPQRFVGLLIRNNDGATTGRIKDIHARLVLLLPIGTTLTKVI